MDRAESDPDDSEQFAEQESDPGDSEPFAEQDRSGRYIRYDDVLGKGAFKTVYKAFDMKEGIEVAWSKVRTNDDAHLQRLFTEIGLLMSLDHDHIIKIFSWWVVVEDSDIINGSSSEPKNKMSTLNMITELFNSGSLKQFRNKHRRIQVKVVKKWARQILKGLSYLHSHNPVIVHRDLKCDNVFVNGIGDVKIGDLGLALVMMQEEEGGTDEFGVVGTPGFIAPEMYEGKYNELVDVYSFGMCLLEMVTCEYPYKECRNRAHVYKKVMSGEMPAALRKVKDPVKGFIDKCLVPASARLSAVELLNDPFLAADDSMEPRTYAIDINTEKSIVSISNLEGRRSTKSNDLTLRAKRSSDSSGPLVFALNVVGRRGKILIEFEFCLEEDTAVKIAGEMVDEELGLSTDDVFVVAGMIDKLIMKIVPNWKPSTSVAYSSCGCGATTSDDSPKKSACSGKEMSETFKPSSICSLLSKASVGDKHHHDQLREEHDLIDAEHEQELAELKKMKEEAVQGAKKKLSGPD